jgi:hypothetical protein
MTLFKWSQTAASNSSIDSTINAREGQAPSTVNDAMRGIMAAVAKFRDDLSGNLVTGGSSTAYTLTTNQGFTALTDGLYVRARLSATNGAAPTLNVDSLGAKAIAKVYGTAVGTGELLSGGVYDFTYDATDDKWIVGGNTEIKSIQGYTFTLTGNFIRSGAHSLTLTTTGATDVTFPTAGTLASLAGTETLTNKTINLTSNTLAATVAQLNSAISDGDVATLAGAETLTNKTLTSPTINGGAISGALVRATAQATTSGTAVDFAIPSGVKRITLILDTVGLAGSDTFLVQIGDAGGVETTSYTSNTIIAILSNFVGGTTATTGFVMSPNGVNATGTCTLHNITGNVWVASHLLELGSAIATGSGRKELSAELTTVRLTRSGSNTFDTGTVNVICE